jgi:ABC-type Mn2+/Zn2+ transport system permease subunit
VFSQRLVLLSVFKAGQPVEHFKTPGLDGSFLYGLGIPGLWHFILSFLALAVLYGLAWKAAQRASGWPAWLIVLGGSLALGVILLYMAPSTPRTLR